MAQSISIQTLKRLPVYLRYLKSLPEESPSNISAKQIAHAMDLVEIQVRKDLAAVSSKGKPRVGYNIQDLLDDLTGFLGYNEVNDAVLVGAGRLGRALMSYKGFADYGLNIVAAFDTDESVVGMMENGKVIMLFSKLPEICERMQIHIGIITVPVKAAQVVCDILVKNGVLAIWNFTPVHLNVPDKILVKSENMAASLAVLSKHLAEKLHENDKE